MVEDLKKAQEYIQFEIDALEAETIKTPNHPNCGCVSLERLRETLERDAGKQFPRVEVIELEVPVGTPPEDIIQRAIEKIYGGK